MRVSSLVAIVGALAVSVVVPLAAQSAKYSPPRTPDGKPDLQGTFTFATITPLQRPDALKDKEVLTPEEAAQFEDAENKRLNRDLYDPEKGMPSAGYPGRAQGGVLSYNDFWYERGDKLTEDRRSSLIYDPPDGRIPVSAETRQRQVARAAKTNAGQFDDPEDLSLVDRCILGFNAGPPMNSGTYNNNLDIVQTPKYVVIHNEMVHNARVIPTDGRPHGTIARWTGDSVGHWEGDTLVVETINFRRETSTQGSTANTKVVERFTRVGPDTIDYRYTVSDPTAYTRPWSAAMPLRRIDERLFEYACHEANYGMEGVLRGARYREKNPPPAPKP
jgi:hypothetical protein